MSKGARGQQRWLLQCTAEVWGISFQVSEFLCGTYIWGGKPVNHVDTNSWIPALKYRRVDTNSWILLIDPDTLCTSCGFYGFVEQLLYEYFASTEPSTVHQFIFCILKFHGWINKGLYSQIRLVNQGGRSDSTLNVCSCTFFSQSHKHRQWICAAQGLRWVLVVSGGNVQNREFRHACNVLSHAG